MQEKVTKTIADGYCTGKDLEAWEKDDHIGGFSQRTVKPCTEWKREREHYNNL